MNERCASSVNQLAAGRVTAQPAEAEKTTGLIAVYPSRCHADQLLNHKEKPGLPTVCSVSMPGFSNRVPQKSLRLL